MIRPPWETEAVFALCLRLDQVTLFYQSAPVIIFHTLEMQHGSDSAGT